MSSEVDSHTEFEVGTFAYALLKEFDEDIADEFYESAFPHEQTKENARALLASLPPNFIQSLIQSSCPDTTFKSIIQNSGSFPAAAPPRSARQSSLVRDRLGSLCITYRLVGHTRCVHHIALDALNIVFFSGSDDSMIKCWHVPSMSLVCTFKGHEDGVTGLVVSPDRQLLASWSEDKFVRLWSLIDGACVAVFSLFDQDSVKCAAFSPCNRYLAAVSGAGIVRVLRVSKLIPCLASAAKALGADGRIPPGFSIADLLFPDGDFSPFEECDPQAFLKQQPRLHKQSQLKVPASSIAFSPGGNFAAVALTNGTVVVISMQSQRRWTLPAHEVAADGAIFMRNNFHSLLTWSQKGGEIKFWKFQDRPQAIATFSVRTQSRRSHLVTVSMSCDECLLFACTAQAIFAWKMENTTPLLHRDDSLILTMISDVCAHPKLPTVFMAVTKSLLTLWDVCLPAAPFHQLIIPVETPRIQTARWAPDGLSVIASDAFGGIYIFKVSDGPECRTMPQFFETDFTVSAWLPDRGQVEDSNGIPSHLQSRSVLMDDQRIQMYSDYRPYSLRELAARPMVGPVLKYAWLNEEIWLRKMAKPKEEKKAAPPAQTKSVDDFDSLEQDLIDDESETDDDKDADLHAVLDSSGDGQSPRLRSDSDSDMN
jgi:WD40 repeat protein